MNNITMAANNYEKAKQLLEKARKNFVQSIVDVVADNPNGIYASDIVQVADNTISTQAVVRALTSASTEIVSMKTKKSIKFVQLNEDGTINPNKSIIVKTLVRKYYTLENVPMTNKFF